jgi:hypothetical protein
MVDLRQVGLFVGIVSPSLLLTLISVDAPLMAGQDVFLFSAVQVLLIGVYMYRQ